MDERQYIKEALYNWVAAVIADSGRTEQFVFDNGKNPRLVPPFISLSFVGTNTPGLKEYSPVMVDSDGNGAQQIREFVKRSLTMYAFAESAFDLLEEIKASIYVDAYMDMLSRKGLVIPYAQDVTENPAAMDDQRENSALFDFFLTYARVRTYTSLWIETVEITPHGLPMEQLTISSEEENSDG